MVKWMDFKPAFAYFYDELFEREIRGGYIPMPAVEPDTAKKIAKLYGQLYRYEDDKDTWFEKVKELAVRVGFAKDMKSYRKDPDHYRGHVGDVAMVLRVALTNRLNTPDLYEITQVMGEKRVQERLNAYHIMGEKVKQ